MAKSKKNDTAAIGALTADSVILTTWHGRTVATRKRPPKMRKGNSPKQQKSVDRFRQAHAYADEILTYPEKRAIYEKGVNPKRTSAHAVALQDFLHPPVIDYIKVHDFTGKAGDVFTIKATDDFRVEAVAIEMFDRDGKLLENGNAERYKRRPFIWKYKMQLANKDFVGTTIVATATDMPGNKGERTGVLEIKVGNK